MPTHEDKLSVRMDTARLSKHNMNGSLKMILNESSTSIKSYNLYKLD